MDISTVVGLVLAIGLVLGSILMGGGLGDFIDPPSAMIVIGGSFAATLMNFELRVAITTIQVVKKCFLVKLPSPAEVIEQFRDFMAYSERHSRTRNGNLNSCSRTGYGTQVAKSKFAADCNCRP